MAGTGVALTGGCVFARWMLGWVDPAQAVSAITMKTNTSLAMLLAGFSLLLLLRKDAARARRWLGRFCAASVLLIGALILSENVIGWDLHIDQLLAKEPVIPKGVLAPNRMGPPASVVFTLAGGALLLLSARRRQAILIAQVLALIICSIALLPTVGYLYGAHELYGLARYTGIALPTAIALLMLGMGLLCMRPDQGLMAQATADDPGGQAFRRLFPALLLLVVVVGWLKLTGERQGVYGSDLGTALRTLTSVIIIAALLYYSTRRLSQATAETRREKELLGVTLASIGDGVIVTDAQGRVTFLNAVAQRLTGWTNEEARGRPLPEVFNIIHEATRKPMENPVDKVLRLGTVVELANHTLLIQKGGREVPIDDSGAPVRSPDGTIHGVVLVFRDFSRQKAAEDKLRRLNRTLRALGSSSQAMMRASDESQYLQTICRIIIEDCGHAMVWVGYAEDDEAKSVRPVAQAGFEEGYLDTLNITWADTERGRGPTGTAVRTGTPSLCRNMLTDPRFTPWRAEALKRGYASSVVLPLRADGKSFGAISIYSREADPFSEQEIKLLSDLADDLAYGITAIRLRQAHAQAEQEVREAKEAAEAANKAKDHFLAVLSHELRTPLTPVLATVSMLQAEREHDADTQEALELIRRNAELEAHLIDDLLDVTRIARGKIELNRHPIQLKDIIRRTVDVCRSDIEAKRLKFGVDMGDASSCWVEADAARIQQVFWNLLKNAIKFTPEGGSVGFRCRRDNDGHAVTEVSDSGVGLESEALGRIFNAFEQAERSITRQFGGLGLGLTISKALVEMHGGTISAHSEGRGKGATMQVSLPVTMPPAESASIPAATQPSGARAASRPLKILLVEDHEDTIRIMTRLLTRQGHEVQSAANVAGALELAARQPFDLLISDLGLPDASGTDLIRELRSQGQTLPAIALSGYGQEEDLNRTHKAGFDAHLTKPVNVELLFKTIAGLAK